MCQLSRYTRKKGVDQSGRKSQHKREGGGHGQREICTFHIHRKKLRCLRWRGSTGDELRKKKDFRIKPEGAYLLGQNGGTIGKKKPGGSSLFQPCALQLSGPKTKGRGGAQGIKRKKNSRGTNARDEGTEYLVHKDVR